jgi:hypothetical protein
MVDGHNHCNGLKRKYIVLKADTGKPVDNCFVLRPYKDPAAVAALTVYARVTNNRQLHNDILNWISSITPEQRGRSEKWLVEHVFRTDF